MSTKAGRIKNGEIVNLGSWPPKKGEVLCFQPAESMLPVPVIHQIADGRRIFDGYESVFARYIVEVSRTGKDGKPLPPEYRAPLAGKLEKDNPRAARRKS